MGHTIVDVTCPKVKDGVLDRARVVDGHWQGPRDHVPMSLWWRCSR